MGPRGASFGSLPESTELLQVAATRNTDVLARPHGTDNATDSSCSQPRVNSLKKINY